MIFFHSGSSFSRLGRSFMHCGTKSSFWIQRKSVHIDGNLQRISSDMLPQCFHVSFLLHLLFKLYMSFFSWHLFCITLYSFLYQWHDSVLKLTEPRIKRIIFIPKCTMKIHKNDHYFLFFFYRVLQRKYTNFMTFFSFFDINFFSKFFVAQIIRKIWKSKEFFYNLSSKEQLFSIEPFLSLLPFLFFYYTPWWFFMYFLTLQYKLCQKSWKGIILLWNQRVNKQKTKEEGRKKAKWKEVEKFLLFVFFFLVPSMEWQR